MARYTGPKVKLSRRVGVPVADTPKHTAKRQLTAPGMHGFRGKRKGSWKLVIATADEGTESLRLTLGPASDNFVWLDWDGSWAILSRGFGKPAVAIHTTEDSPQPQNICNLDRTALLTGVVTLVRHTSISTDSGIA
jgi:hypothetical protein